MRNLLAALVAAFLCLPAQAQDQCVNETFVTLRIVKAYTVITLQERFEGAEARRFGQYIAGRYKVPTAGDLIIQFGAKDSLRVYVVFFKEGCMIHDSFVSRALYEAKCWQTDDKNGDGSSWVSVTCFQTSVRSRGIRLR